MEAINMTVRHPEPAAPVAWDQELKGAHYLLRSNLCPKDLKTPEAVLFVILAGRDLGLSPVASLRNITVIQGKIELAADMQLALFAKAGGRFKWATLTAETAVLELGAPWIEGLHRSTFTMDDAKRAGLVNDTWRKYPKAMLRSRAITQGLKDVGFDATTGVYAPGEIGGESEIVEIGVGTEYPDDGTHDTPDEPVLQKPGANVPTEPASDAQRNMIRKLAKSHVWTEKERDALNTYADMDGLPKARATEILDNALNALATRKAEEAAQEKVVVEVGAEAE